MKTPAFDQPSDEDEEKENEEDGEEEEEKEEGSDIYDDHQLGSWESHPQASPFVPRTKYLASSTYPVASQSNKICHEI